MWIEDLATNGPPGPAEPRKPTSSYKSLLHGTKRRRTVKLVGQKLHEYLVTKCVGPYEVSCPTVIQVGSFGSLEDIKIHLISGYELLKNTNSRTLATSIDYGDWLNVAFELHTMEQNSGNEISSWENWLHENVGIGTSYGRKLRKISEVLGKFPGFRRLGLSITEVYEKIKQIKSLVLTNVKAAEYWQQAS
jgi:hypothetical protein